MISCYAKILNAEERVRYILGSSTHLFLLTHVSVSFYD